MHRTWTQVYRTSADAIRRMGDKATAKKTMADVGFPVVPGLDGTTADVNLIKAWAAKAGYPILVKATAGGGGKGMRLVESEDQVAEMLEVARAEAMSNFGNPDVYIEKFILKLVTLNFRCWPTNMAMSFTCANEIAPFNAVTRS